MQQLQQIIEEAQGGAIHRAADGLTVSRLNHLEVPRRELIPKQFVHCHQCFAQAVLYKQVGYFGSHFVLFGLKPVNGFL